MVVGFRTAFMVSWLGMPIGPGGSPTCPLLAPVEYGSLGLLVSVSDGAVPRFCRP